MTTTKATEKVVPALELHVETNPQGQVTSTVPVSWTLPDELIDYVEEHYTNPHVVLIVARVVTEKYGKEETTTYIPTKMYVIDLLRKPQKEYVQFSAVGQNVLLARVIDIDKEAASDLSRIQRYISSGDRRLATVSVKKDGDLDWYTWPSSFDNPLLAVAIQPVVVPKELFAKERPKWQRNLVNQFFDGKAFDECHFRKRLWFGAIPLSIPVQIYGIFARFFVLIFALFMAFRSINFRELFALNPHDFAHSLGDSWWLEDKNGDDRGWVAYITPPFLVLWAFCVGIGGGLISLPALLYMTLTSTHTGADGKSYIDWSWSQLGWGYLVIDLPLAVVIFLIWLFANSDGKKLRRDIARKLQAKQLESIQPAGTAAYAALRKRQAASLSAAAVPDNTIHLAFHAVKRAVCRPFARYY